MNPQDVAEAFQQRYHTAPREDLPVFHGGLVGYFGCDTVGYISWAGDMDTAIAIRTASTVLAK